MNSFTLLQKEVITPDFCVGCGVCVSLCNHGTIGMQFNDVGKYEPFYIDESTCTSCGLCVKVCPFLSQNDNEDTIGKEKFLDQMEISHHEDAGFFLENYVGYADSDTRLNGASGGGLSQLLKWLLASGKVDRIVTVEGTNNPDKLFQYTIVDTPEDIDRCARSAYYPVEISDVLTEVRKSKGVRYAIVGLPCAVKAVELAKKTFPALKRKILFTFGIVCGQTKTKKYAEFLIDDLGVRKELVKSINFRKKVPGYPSSNFAFEVTFTDNSTRHKMFGSGVGKIWTSDFAKLNSCYYCDDIFAECADAVFMDAWLPAYTKEYEGTNLVINRHPELSTFFSSHHYEPIEIEQVVQSQYGVVINKRAFRDIYTQLATPNTPPPKRTFQKQYKTSCSEKALRKQKFQWAKETREGNLSTQKRVAKEMLKRKLFPAIKKKVKNLFKKIGLSK